MSGMPAEGYGGILEPEDIGQLKDSIRAVGMTLTRIEKVMRDELEVSRSNRDHASAIAANTACLPQLAKDLARLLDVLVPKRTNGHTDMEQASSSDAEGTTEP